jgi:hypothetical protein
MCVSKDKVILNFDMSCGGVDVEEHKRSLSVAMGVPFDTECFGDLDRIQTAWFYHSLQYPLLFFVFDFTQYSLKTGETFYCTTYFKNGRYTNFDSTDRKPSPANYDECKLEKFESKAYLENEMDIHLPLAMCPWMERS